MEFDTHYYQKYLRKNFIGKASGERTYLYRYWLRFFKKTLPPNAEILDLGCGLGFFSCILSKKFQVTGIDVSEVAIQSAEKIAPRAKFVQLEEGGQTIPFSDESFDAAVAFDVLEHQNDPQKLLNELFRVIKKQGWLTISVPNTQSIGAKVRKGAWYALTDPTHVSLLSQDEWIDLLSRCGWIVSRMGTDFLWDVPYVPWIPAMLQRLALVSLQWSLVWSFGPLHWSYGETLYLVARKPAASR